MTMTNNEIIIEELKKISPRSPTKILEQVAINLLSKLNISEEGEVVAEGIIRYENDDYYFRGDKEPLMDKLLKNKAFGTKIKIIREVK